MSDFEKEQDQEEKEIDIEFKNLTIKLVKLSKSGDNEAFGKLVKMYKGRVYAMIINLVKNEDDAWDLAQDTFLKAWKAINKFREESSFYTWIFRIGHNTCYDWLRKNNRMHKSELDDNIFDNKMNILGTPPSKIQDPVKSLENKEMLEHIKKAIDELTYDHKAIILLKEVNGLSYKEISKVLDCSMGTVMSRLYYARKILQNKLTKFV